VIQKGVVSCAAAGIVGAFSTVVSEKAVGDAAAPDACSIGAAIAYDRAIGGIAALGRHQLIRNNC
jgi:hypothetical protein